MWLIYLAITDHRSFYQRPNATFYYTEDSPFVKLQLLRPVEMNDEILVDYGEDYPYKARKFRG